MYEHGIHSLLSNRVGSGLHREPLGSSEVVYFFAAIRTSLPALPALPHLSLVNKRASGMLDVVFSWPSRLTKC